MSFRQDRLRSYLALLRMARVREAMAGAELAEAATDENRQRTRRQGVLDERIAVAQAGERCRTVDGGLDMARYEMLSRLDTALTDKLQQVSSELANAECIKQEKAQANWQAKRYRERAGEQFDVARTDLHREHRAKEQEEAIELWAERRKDEA